jgi:hypothetical protein
MAHGVTMSLRIAVGQNAQDITSDRSRRCVGRCFHLLGDSFFRRKSLLSILLSCPLFPVYRFWDETPAADEKPEPVQRKAEFHWG